MEHATVAIDGGDLAYRRAGRSGAPALVLLHGITDGSAAWRRVVAALTKEFDLIAPDARGHGDSSRVPGALTLDTLASDTAAIIDHLGVAPALVWGHSMGAATAAALAAARPDLVSRIVLEDPPFRASDAPEAAGPADPYLEAFLELLGTMRSMTPAERLAIARRDNPTWHPDEQEPWAETKAKYDPNFTVTGGLGAGWRATLARVECPVLLVTGDASVGAIVTPEVAREAVSLLPRGVEAHIPGAGHSVHRDRFDAVISQVKAFLNQD